MQLKRQGGVAMIEALIGLVVLALGLLALAWLQSGNLSNSRHTNARSIAVQMAADLKERMALNQGAMSPDPNLNPYRSAFGSEIVRVDCSAAPCNAANLAARDIADWKGQLAALLPDGDAQVFAIPGDRGQFGVLIAWREIAAKNQAVARSAQNANQQAAYTAGDAVWRRPDAQGTGIQTVACPADRICHLVHIRP